MSDVESSTHFSDLNTWFGYLGDETMCLIDPYTGKRLNPHMPPAAVAQDPELAGGLEYWQRNGEKICVQPYYSRHDDPGDLGPPEVFERQIQTLPYFGYESLDAYDNALHVTVARKVLQAISDIGAEQNLDNYLKVYRGLVPSPPSNMLGRTEFTRRLFRGIALRTDPSLPFEIRPDGTRVERDLIASRPANEPSTLGEFAVSMARTNLFDWARIALFGQTLEEQTGPTLRDPIEVGKWQGLAHRDASRKLNCLGVKVAEEVLLGPIPSVVANKWELLSTGVINLDSLRAMVPPQRRVTTWPSGTF